MAVMEDDENESAGSDVPMLHQRKYRHYSEGALSRTKSPLTKPMETKSMETHFDSTVHSVPQGKAAPDIGTREAPDSALPGSSPNQGHSNFQPSIVVEDVGELNSTAVHRRIDGLYEQLEGLERKFDEQKCAIIEVLLGKTVLSGSPTSGSNMRPGPGYHPMPAPSQRPSNTTYRRADTYQPPNEIQAKEPVDTTKTEQAQQTVQGDYNVSPTSPQPRLLRREQEDAGFRHSSLPNSISKPKQDGTIGSDPGVIVTSMSHPPQGANPGSDVGRRRNPSHFTRPGRRGPRPSSVPGRIQSGANRGESQNAPALSFPAGNWTGSEVIWLERKGEDPDGSRLSSTSC